MQQMTGFDIIFCCNVLIYFDQKSKIQVVSNLYDALNRGGYLFIGYAESLHGISTAFKLVNFPEDRRLQEGVRPWVRVILAVDDSATVRKFVSVSLSMQGFQVITASDGMDALEKLPQQQVDLLMTDLNMPNMDGFELIRALRENPQYKDLPVIILTSLTDEVSRETGAKLGVNSFLVKPFSLEKIQYEVAKYVSWAE